MSVKIHVVSKYGLDYDLHRMITRQKEFLREIISNYFGVTEEELCENASITEKTLRSDLQVMEDTLRTYHLSLCFDHNRIYIPFDRKDSYLEAYEEIIKADEGVLLSGEQEERKMNILLYLTKSDAWISMNTLADRFYVSKASISNAIHELEDEIPEYEPNARLDISKHGIRINASEKMIREILVKAFTKAGGNVLENPYFLAYLEPDLKEKLPHMVETVDSFLKEENIAMSNMNVSKLIVHTMVVSQRYRKNRYLDERDCEAGDIYERYAKKLAFLDCEVPAKEYSCLPLQQLNRSIIKHKESEEIVETFISTINRKYKSEILNINDAYQLIAHVDECIDKGFHRTDMYDFVQDQMLQRLLSAYILSGDLCRIIEDTIGIQPNEENRGYMAMYIQGMYRKNLVIRENMLLFDRSISQCEMMKTDLEKHFGPKAVITPVYVLWDIEKELENKDYAIILSTKSLLGSFNNVPFIKVHPFLTTEDYEKIDKIVYKNQPVEIQSVIYQDGKMNVNGISYSLSEEILFIKNVYLTTVREKGLETGVYGMAYQGKKLFVFNYNLSDSFIVYHRLINRFGQMLKEGKIG